ncbi:MAG: hypothetical protein H6Q86_3208, partial [candidate division NC10 bacterium]|nr:hypothetical protein [candidate division NC10 bacterium]
LGRRGSVTGPKGRCAKARKVKVPALLE